MMISDLRERIRQGLLEFAWRQWAQAGVSANIAALDRWAIDPEALILFTIEVARRDPRLFDELLDWLAVNRQLLTLQRLSNLAMRFPIDRSLVAAVFASLGAPVPLSLSRQGRHGEVESSQATAVFSPDVLSFVGTPDPVFLDYGYLRPRAVLSGKSREPDTRLLANFSFQLRHLFGASGRSEIIRILLTFTDGPLDAARIADETGFARRNVNDILSNLVEARVVKARGSANKRVFLAYRNKWVSLLERGSNASHLPEYVPWVHFFPACLEIMSWLEAEPNATDSHYLRRSRVNDLIERISHHLEPIGLSSDLKYPHAIGEPERFILDDIANSLLEFMRV